MVGMKTLGGVGGTKRAAVLAGEGSTPIEWIG